MSPPPSPASESWEPLWPRPTTFNTISPCCTNDYRSISHVHMLFTCRPTFLTFCSLWRLNKITPTMTIMRPAALMAPN